jgi:hypothetical protein
MINYVLLTSKVEERLRNPEAGSFRGKPVAAACKGVVLSIFPASRLPM